MQKRDPRKQFHPFDVLHNLSLVRTTAILEAGGLLSEESAVNTLVPRRKLALRPPSIHLLCAVEGLAPGVDVDLVRLLRGGPVDGERDGVEAKNDRERLSKKVR